MRLCMCVYVNLSYVTLHVWTLQRIILPPITKSSEKLQSFNVAFIPNINSVTSSSKQQRNLHKTTSSNGRKRTSYMIQLNNLF
jgi:hypothetical protein